MAETAVCCVLAALLTWLGRAPLFALGRAPLAVTIAALLVWWGVFLVVLLPNFMLVIDTWLVTLCYFGGRPPLFRAIRLMEFSRAGAIWFGSICAILLAAMIAFRHVPFAVAVGLLLLLHYLSGLTNAAQPPTMLVLANSNEKALWLQERLSGELVPHRVVSLLRLTGDSEWHKRGTSADIVRTRSDDDWRTVVAGLLELVPIVMIDVRIETDFVRDEVAEVRRRGLEYKALFLVGGGLPAPLLDQYLGHSDIAWAHDWSASGFLWYVTHYRRLHPTPSLPMSQLYRHFSDHLALAGGNGTEMLHYLESVLDRIPMPVFPLQA